MGKKHYNTQNNYKHNAAKSAAEYRLWFPYV